MVFHTGNPEDAIKQNVRINKFSKSKIQNQRNYFFFLYTNDKLLEREMNKTILFTNSSKRMKYLRINVREEIKDLNTIRQYEKTEDTNNGRDSMLMDWKNYYCQNTQSNLQIECYPD